MALSHPIPDRLAEPVARRFHLPAEPMRIRLLDRLRDRSLEQQLRSPNELLEGVTA